MKTKLIAIFASLFISSCCHQVASYDITCTIDDDIIFSGEVDRFIMPIGAKSVQIFKHRYSDPLVISAQDSIIRCTAKEAKSK